MKTLSMSTLYLLVATYDANIEASKAADMVGTLLEHDELMADLWEAREQAYNGLNANYGDYVKAVMLSVLAKRAAVIEAETANKLLELQVEIDRLSN